MGGKNKSGPQHGICVKSFSCLLARVHESGANCLAESLLKMACILDVQIFIIIIIIIMFYFFKEN